MRVVQGGGTAWKEALRSQLSVGKLYLSTPSSPPRAVRSSVDGARAASDQRLATVGAYNPLYEGRAAALSPGTRRTGGSMYMVTSGQLSTTLPIAQEYCDPVISRSSQEV